MRTNLFHIVLLAFFLTMNFSLSFSQDIKKKKTKIPVKTIVKPEPQNNLEVAKVDLKKLVQVKDSTKKD